MDYITKMEENIEEHKEVLEEKLKTKQIPHSTIKGRKGTEIDIDEKLIGQTASGKYLKEMREHIKDFKDETDIQFRAIIESANNLGVHTHISGEMPGEVRKKAAEVMRKEYPSEKITTRDYGHDKDGELYHTNGDTCIDFKVINEIGIHARPSALMVKKAGYLCEVYGGQLDFISPRNDKKSKMDATSILAWMMTAFEKGEKVTVTRKTKYGNNEPALMDFYNYATSKQFAKEEE